MSDNIVQNIDENNVFSGEIVDQTVSQSARGEVQVVVTARVAARLLNPKNAAGGTEACPPRECEVLITLPEDAGNRLEWALLDLKLLGFTDDDVARLHPDHPDSFSLVGKAVYLRCKRVAETEYWNLVRMKKSLTADEAGLASSSLKGKIAEARKKIREQPTRTANP